MSLKILQPGFDPTGATQITGAQLAQLVASASFAINIGGNYLTTDDTNGNPTVPDPDADPTIKPFIWLRVGNPATSGNVVTPYVWNPNQARGALYRWQQIQQSSIGTASILGYMIAPAQIDKTKIAGTLDPSQIAGLAPLSQFLTNASTPSAGSAIIGSFLAGLVLAANAINNINQFQAGVISNNTPFSGQVLLAANILTTGAANNSVLMAPTGAAGLAAWLTKAILTLAEPNGGTQAGNIPVVQNDGSYALKTPTQAFPAGSISSACEVFGTGSITVSSVSATTNIWTINTANTGTLIANQTYVTFAGYGTKYNNLNGTWLVTAVTTNTSFSVTTTSNIAGSGTTVIGTTKYANFIGNSNLNIASVFYNSVGNYTINFTAPLALSSYIALVDTVDTLGTTALIKAKVIAKSTGSIQIQVYQIGTGGGSITAIDVADLSVITI